MHHDEHALVEVYGGKDSGMKEGPTIWHDLAIGVRDKHEGQSWQDHHELQQFDGNRKDNEIWICV